MIVLWLACKYHVEKNKSYACYVVILVPSGAQARTTMLTEIL